MPAEFWKTLKPRLPQTTANEVVDYAFKLLLVVVDEVPNGQRLIEAFPDLPSLWQAATSPTKQPSDWTAFREAMLGWRYLVLAVYEGKEDQLLALVSAKPDHPLSFAGRCLVWCWLFGTAEGDERDDGDKIAFIPWPIQVEILARFCWLMLARPDKGRDLAILKSRQTGITTLFVHIWCYLWVSTRIRLGLGSYRADEVDKNPRSLNPHSLLGRCERIFDAMPEGVYMDQRGSLASSRLRQEMQWINPDTRARLDGEAASEQFTRSRSYDDMLVDEWAMWRDPLTILASSHPNIGMCRVLLTTPAEGLTDLESYYDRIKQHFPYRYMEVHWWDHPERDDEWERAARIELGDARFDIEHGLSFQAAVEQAVYPEWLTVRRADSLPFVPDFPLIGGIDYGRRDGTAILIGQVTDRDWFRVLAAHYSVGQEIAFYYPLMDGRFRSGQFHYTDEERAWIDRLQVWLARTGGIEWFGDPSGENITQLANESVARDLAMQRIYVTSTPALQSHDERQAAARKLMRRTEISLDHCAALDNAMKRYRYPKQRLTSAIPNKRPIHHYSHLPAAFEYIAVHEHIWDRGSTRLAPTLSRQAMAWESLR
jgi:hypothetical protein